MPVNNHFIESVDYENYRLWKQSHEYNGHISGNFEKRAKRMHLQMKPAVIN